MSSGTTLDLRVEVAGTTIPVRSASEKVSGRCVPAWTAGDDTTQLAVSILARIHCVHRVEDDTLGLGTVPRGWTITKSDSVSVESVTAEGSALAVVVNNDGPTDALRLRVAHGELQDERR